MRLFALATATCSPSFLSPFALAAGRSVANWSDLFLPPKRVVPFLEICPWESKRGKKDVYFRGGEDKIFIPLSPRFPQKYRSRKLKHGVAFIRSSVSASDTSERPFKVASASLPTIWPISRVYSTLRQSSSVCETLRTLLAAVGLHNHHFLLCSLPSLTL